MILKQLDNSLSLPINEYPATPATPSLAFRWWPTPTRCLIVKHSNMHVIRTNFEYVKYSYYTSSIYKLLRKSARFEQMYLAIEHISIVLFTPSNMISHIKNRKQRLYMYMNENIIWWNKNVVWLSFIAAYIYLPIGCLQYRI